MKAANVYAEMTPNPSTIKFVTDVMLTKDGEIAEFFSLNEAKGELHYQNNISKGQELIDLKEALDKNAITEEEFLVMKQKIIDDVYIKEFFEELNKLDKSEDDTESASI